MNDATTTKRESAAFGEALCLLSEDQAWLKNAVAFNRFDEPWDVLMFEIMSQQTQAARAREKHDAFKEKWPTVHDLADAPRADIIAEWTGLGYYRRAKNLHLCAIEISENHGGIVPDTYKKLISLPGVGDYTANAVLSFAFNQTVIPVDTNIARVVARITNTVFTKSELTTFLTSHYDLLAYLDPQQGTTSQDVPLNLAAKLMTLGASICTAKNYRCDICPVKTQCLWHKIHDQETTIDPAAKGAYKPTKQAKYAGSVRQYRGQILKLLKTKPMSETAIFQALQKLKNKAPKPAVTAQSPIEEKIAAAIQGLEDDSLITKTPDGSYSLG